MRFEVAPKLILTKDEFETLDKALKLCRDMDEETGRTACATCPLEDSCSHMSTSCLYARAHTALKDIIDIVTVEEGKYGKGLDY